MLAAEEREVQCATNGIQRQHDGACRLHGEPDVPRRMAAWDAMELQHPGTGSGDSYAVPGTDRSGRCDRGPERGEGGRTDLVELGASLVPVLRCRRGSHHYGP